MTLLAAFQTLLYRYTRQHDVAVGSPIAGRSHPEIEGLIGFFVNMLVLRSDLSGNPTFKELLTRVRKTAFGAYEHQDVPFEKLVEMLRPERDLSRSPLFQVMFAFQNMPRQAIELPGLTVSPVEVQNETTKYDIGLYMWEEPTGLPVRLEYNTALFDGASIKRMVGHLERLLEAIVDNPEGRISELSILSDSERQQLLVKWNETGREFPETQCIHQFFEARVARSPDSTALVYENKRLTYGELNARANRLAHHLQSLGVGPEVLVGIFMERSVEMVIGILAVLKAGGAYVPLDPDYPQERLACMLEDAGISVLLTQEPLVKSLPAHEAKVVCLDADWPAITLQRDENPGSEVTAENLAYVIFTSGSTGRPKGAMNTHRGISNRLLWMQEAYRLQTGDRVLQKTPFSFDVSVWEFFWPLMTGACLVVAVPGGHKDSAYLAQVIAEQKITTIHFVPSMLQAFLHEGNSLGLCGSLKRVICSGEALTPELKDQLFARLDVELHNLYGPTEAAVDVTYWACKRERSLRSVPIGYPIANTQLYLLDSFLQPVPIGVPGELHISGIGLARGYAHRPDLTAEKFIPNPFSDHAGERLYKTGDLAHYRDDGSIEFLGRIDHQVKIRGYRIELGEIETVLRQHPDIRNAVIIDKEVSADKKLIGYVVAEGQENPSTTELKEFLRRKLPEYMVPSSFVFLKDVPLTPSGKLDRKALPEPDRIESRAGEDHVGPRTAMERAIAEAWQEVLGMERVSAHDNFFDLGGHSLLSLKAIVKIEEKIGRRIQPRDMVMQTLRQIAAAYEEHTTAVQETSSNGVIRKWLGSVARLLHR
jgi:amino acid adenylation domain-containing protein